MLRHKFYFLINIFSLSIGMTSSLVILSYVWGELSFDKFHEEAQNVNRVNLELIWGGEVTQQSTTPPPLAHTLKDEFPEVTAATHIYKFDEIIVRDGDNFYAEEALAVDSSFFKVFTFPFAEGNPATALSKPNSIVITQETARRYFNGKQSALGEVLQVGKDNVAYTVTGVVKDIPENSHFRFTMLTSIYSLDFVQEEKDNWSWPRLSTYVRLKNGTSGSTLESKFPDMCTRTMGQPLVDWKKNGGGYTLFLQPITKIHLYSGHLLSHLGPTEDIQYLYILGLVGIFIVLIASINFMNLSTAKSANRAKESGIRKVSGSTRSDLILQFLTESVMLTFFALFIALLVVYALQNQLGEILGKTFYFSMIFQDVRVIGLILLLTIFIGVISGCYPAFYLTSFSTVDILKGKIKSGINAKGIRSALVIFQFALSIGFIICTSLVYQQLQHMREQKLGFDKENVVVIVNSNDRLMESRMAFKQELLRQSQVESVSFTNSFPGKEYRVSALKPEGASQDILLKSSFIDYDYLQTLKIDLLAGRNFSQEMTSDMMTDDEASVIIINEAAAEQIKVDDPVNQYLDMTVSNQWKFKFQIIGVVKDFNFQSLKAKVEPMILFLAPNAAEYILVRIKPGNTQSALAKIKDVWNQFAPSVPFDYSFIDDHFDQLYKSEMRLGKIFSVFSGLAVIVASLGLFGLTSFTTEQRSKEIGIRKVLGASESSIVMMLTGNIVKLIMIAFVIAAPFAYVLMNQWLQGFAYRISIHVYPFLIAAVVAVLLALVTVGYQSIKASLLDPVDTLRS
ncbi:ABC transporter permease [Chryseolinea lacunae]|uniref:ABC transporter permease n=1 Tax=Chryseolinea lacunae TaxID=2801331 RepID=A0ABS1KPN7_9BACT|nr:ABC transporter permease [Chryseolinea lacunae]MBL0741386.1 ABC transporter permease [Chryseolinea lacunae]